MLHCHTALTWNFLHSLYFFFRSFRQERLITQVKVMYRKERGETHIQGGGNWYTGWVVGAVQVGYTTGTVGAVGRWGGEGGGVVRVVGASFAPPVIDALLFSLLSVCSLSPPLRCLWQPVHSLIRGALTRSAADLCARGSGCCIPRARGGGVASGPRVSRGSR